MSNISEGSFYHSAHPEINIADINLSQLARNIELIRKSITPETRLMVVVKGDAYGHGLVPVSQELEKNACDAIGVVRLTEALALRKADIRLPINMLAPLMPSQASWAVEYDITPMVDSQLILSVLEEHGSRLNKTVNVHLKVNTGLNRYGIECRDVVSFVTEARKYTHIRFEGIYTHFKDAENDPSFTNYQLNQFKMVLEELEKRGLRPPLAHAAGSAAIIDYPETHLDMVRCGIILYGLEHKEGDRVLPDGMKPLMTLKSSILRIVDIKKGESGGYGSAFTAKRDSRVAVVGIGYADGISRGWKEVLIGGQRAPAINYFMDGLLVDITDVKSEVKEFDEAVIIGQQGNEAITWSEACRSMNSYIDEQFQRITERVPKNYFYEPGHQYSSPSGHR